MLLLFFMCGSLQTHAGEGTIPDRGTVLEVVRIETEQTSFSGGSLETTVQVLRVRVDNGVAAGMELEAKYTQTFGFSNDYLAPSLKAGDKVVLMFEEDLDGNLLAYVTDVVREGLLFWLLAAFLGLLILLGGLKGLKTILTLSITVAAIFFILIPAMLRGGNPIWLTMGICSLVSIISLPLIGGFNRKTAAAIFGTVGGVVAAGIIARSVGVAARLTGLSDDEAQFLMYLPGEVVFDFQGLLFAGIIIGALGAVMDVSVSIASSLYELKSHNPDLPARGLIQSGMRIGRDMMGTMSNTLILAYTGGSLHLLMLLTAFDLTLREILNRDLIASEIVRALSGSIGLLLAIPLTAIAFALITEHRPPQEAVPDDFKV